MSGSWASVISGQKIQREFLYTDLGIFWKILFYIWYNDIELGNSVWIFRPEMTLTQFPKKFFFWKLLAYIRKNGLDFLSRNDASSIPRNWIFWTDKIDSIKNLSWQWNTVRIPSFLPNSWILVSFNCIELKMVYGRKWFLTMMVPFKFLLTP